MEAKMDMQSMSGHDMANEHNTFWHEDQLILTFHSPTRLISDVVVMGDPILGELRLEEKLPLRNSYLRQNGMDDTLSYLGHIQRMRLSDSEMDGTNTNSPR